MVKIRSSKKNSRKYPPFWERIIPVAIAIIILIIAFLIFATIRVALGLPAF